MDFTAKRELALKLLSETEFTPDMHYHLIGICGTAMASRAGMLQARWHRVTGSDENVSPPIATLIE